MNNTSLVYCAPTLILKGDIAKGRKYDESENSGATSEGFGLLSTLMREVTMDAGRQISTWGILVF